MEKKFKAKRLDTGEWVEFNLDTYSCHRKGCTPYVDKHLAHQMPINKNTICQYTGIDDKEGNRIFEGDELEHWIDGFKYAFFARWDSEDACYDGDCSAWRWRDLKLTGHNIHDRG